MTVSLRPISQINDRIIQILEAGYQSTGRYLVTKEETPERTAIILERAPVDPPYHKSWTITEEDKDLYARFITEGFSIGAYEGDFLVGVGLAEPRRWNQTLWVWELHVDRDFQGKGIGRTLVEHLSELARQANLRALVLETQSTNIPAVDFYYRVGFIIEGVDLSYYTNEDATFGEVAIFMKKML